MRMQVKVNGWIFRNTIQIVGTSVVLTRFWATGEKMYTVSLHPPVSGVCPKYCIKVNGIVFCFFTFRLPSPILSSPYLTSGNHQSGLCTCELFFFFFNIPHIIEIIWYLSFSGWLISFSIMALRALLLAVSWRPSSSSRDHLHSLALVPFPVFKACKGKLNPSHASDLSLFFISSLWPTLLPVSSNFKDSCYYGVPIWIVQDNFCI